MAANSRIIPEKRMHWLSRSTINADSSNISTISEDSGRGLSGRFDIRQRIAHLYRKQLYTDVMFVIQCAIEPKPIFYAHKAILAAGSKHFAEMLFGSEDKLPKTTEPVKKLQINNISPEAFRNVIEFLYTDDMYFDNEPLVIETLLAAKKFEIQPLIDRCESHLEEIELSKSTVCSLLQIATERKIDTLKNRCLSFIQENTGDVIK
ncbi:BTB/POZ domain-containing protein 6-like [Stegodyphus dumicola]|uniref:BTB/POZ domain-containing protein 6-like n=1 Tax=Stegodyphus dumicola TaxID=202533 RepID=UPI0015AFD99B|nr:BTB/POZ domain-containing protein 6-like [Stegodyphus dumicola]